MVRPRRVGVVSGAEGLTTNGIWYINSHDLLVGNRPCALVIDKAYSILSPGGTLESTRHHGKPEDKR